MKTHFEKTLSFAKHRDNIMTITMLSAASLLLFFCIITPIISYNGLLMKYIWFLLGIIIVAFILAFGSFIYLLWAMRHRATLIKQFSYLDAPDYFYYFSKEKYKSLVLDIFVSGIINYFFEKNKAQLVGMQKITDISLEDDNTKYKELILLSFLRNTIIYKDGHFHRRIYVFLGRKQDNKRKVGKKKTNIKSKERYPIIQLSEDYLNLWNDNHSDRKYLINKCNELETNFSVKYAKDEKNDKRKIIIGDSGVIEIFTKVINIEKFLIVSKIILFVLAILVFIIQAVFFYYGFEDGKNIINNVAMFYFEILSMLLLAFEMTAGKEKRFLY